MFAITASSKFLKDLKQLKKRSEKDFNLLQSLVAQLAESGAKGMDQKHKAHKLSGNFRGY